MSEHSLEWEERPEVYCDLPLVLPCAGYATYFNLKTKENIPKILLCARLIVRFQVSKITITSNWESCQMYFKAIDETFANALMHFLE